MAKIYSLIFFICIGISILFSQEKIKIDNSDFEVGLASDIKVWTTNKKELVSIDKSIFYKGNSSLKVNHKDFNSTMIFSEEVKLNVGELYKLSAFIKTDNAFTDKHKQYPTPVAACIKMESFPFTNHSQAIGATNDWTKVEVMFFATKKSDRIELCFGHNGDAIGTAWFDDIQLEKVDDITQYIPKETIKWFNSAFRYEDKGWIYVHIEGEPYQRGYQYGYLVANEIKEFITKFGVNKNKDNPQSAWNNFRASTDLIFLRKYDEEYLTEMKGIADGAKKFGVTIFNRPIDLLDIVTINSAIDLDYAMDAITKTPTPLTGKSFINQEDELDIIERLHKCSGFLATKSATKDNRVVFGQLFMWNGFMGPHWNVIVDVVPTKGNRLVYQTMPGGIHSGADFYINTAGIIIGETTVGQTHFNLDGTPQSNRIRKAAQYANSIDDVVKILTTKNNGMYTNDWLIADSKTDEIAILILGTEKHYVWRSSKNDFYNGQKDWYWSNNNNKSLEVRKEYRVNNDNAPFDLNFRPWDRDVAFWKFYENNYGKIDANAGINLVNTSPINRPHACDGKVTTSEMIEKLMFFANYGKVTMREMFIGENMRIPDLPGAIPRLSLGYTTFSPIFVADKIKALKDIEQEIKNQTEKDNLSEVQNVYDFKKKLLWYNTVYPSSEKENWFISATAGYWSILNNLQGGNFKSFQYAKDEMNELNYRYLYTTKREGTLVPLKAKVVYNEYKHFYIPRIKGIYLLHQLRLKLGNELFSKAMNKIHNEFTDKDITTDKIISIFEKESSQNLKDLFFQWLERDDIPVVTESTNIIEENDKYKIEIKIDQANTPYQFYGVLKIQTEKENIFKLYEIKNKYSTLTYELKDKPIKITLNAGNDYPRERKYFYTFSNFYDDFSNFKIVYGTNRQIEANHTLALRFSKTAADRFTETLLPVVKDCELTDEELKNNDLILIGNINDNSILKRIAQESSLELLNGYFYWKGIKYSDNDDGIFLTIPNPNNPNKIIYIFNSNSALQMYQMLKNLNRFPAWALFKGDQIVSRGYFEE